MLHLKRIFSIMKSVIFVLLFLAAIASNAQTFRPGRQIANDDASLAIQYYQDGEFDKAAVLLEKLFANPNNEGYFDIYFNVLLKLKKYDVAEKTVKKQN